MAENDDIQVDNLKFMVAGHGDKIAIMRLGIEMTRDEALNLAAWLVAMSDPVGERFQKFLDAVRNI